MPFAVIADIHGNVAALEAVLADVKRRCSRRNSARQGDAATIGALTLSRMVMNKTLIALAALFASLISAPAARACDPEDIAEGECARGVRIPSLRQLLPPAIRPSAVAKEQCDADDAAELRECLRGLKIPSARRIAAPDAQPPAEVSEKVAPDRTAGAPAPSTLASSEKSVKPDVPEATSLCQKYFPNIGQLITVPCGE
jgi:hypothetical protein